MERYDFRYAEHFRHAHAVDRKRRGRVFRLVELGRCGKGRVSLYLSMERNARRPVGRGALTRRNGIRKIRRRNGLIDQLRLDGHRYGRNLGHGVRNVFRNEKSLIGFRKFCDFENIGDALCLKSGQPRGMSEVILDRRHRRARRERRRCERRLRLSQPKRQIRRILDGDGFRQRILQASGKRCVPILRSRKQGLLRRSRTLRDGGVPFVNYGEHGEGPMPGGERLFRNEFLRQTRRIGNLHGKFGRR